jgi:ABC-type uncharacterized transport system auxiliary subunit
MSRTRTARRSVALLCMGLAVTVGGCVQLRQPAPDIHTYALAYTPTAPDGPPLPVILRVAPFAVGAVYDHEAIVSREGTYATSLSFYDRWSANPASMLADLLARDFADSQKYRAVQQTASLVPPDYQLSGDIEAIEEYSSGSRCAARLRLRTTLLRTRGGAASPVLSQDTYGADEPCPCQDAAALAQAMSTALATVSTRMQEQVYQAIAADAGARPPAAAPPRLHAPHDPC